MNIITYPSDILRTPASPVENFDDALQQLIAHMIHAMKNAQGIGLAAPQVGISQRLFVIQLSEEDSAKIFINPIILSTSLEETLMREGCLSIPSVYADVLRPTSLSIRAQDQHGKSFIVEARDLFARVIFHEYDHLEGKLFIDYLDRVDRDVLLNKYQTVKSR